LNDRFKEIRIKLDISQEEFGSKIGIKSRAHISALENGTRNITDRIISDTVREFHVNENWLRYGEGDIFDELSDDEETAALIARLCTDNNPLKKVALKAAAKVIEDDACWSIIENELKKYFELSKKE